MFGRHLPWAVVSIALMWQQSAAAQQATQAVQARQQTDLPQRVQGELSSTAMTSSETFSPSGQTDSDIGEQILLQPVQKYQPFSAWTNWNVFWTNNAELLDDTQGSDTFMSGAVGGGYMPHLGGNLFADFSAEQSIFRYAHNGSLDFNSLELKAGLVYVARDLADLTFFGNYTYDLLTARGFNSEIYSDHVLAIGARKVFSLSRAHLFYTSLSAEFTIGGEPTYALRNEFACLAGYQLSLTRLVRLDLYYRASAQDYTHSGRADFTQLIGGGISVEITKWMSVQALSTMGINNSNDSTYSYFSANLGGGIGVLFNF